MADLTHGINILENATQLTTPIEGKTALVVVGTSAINQGETDTPMDLKIAYDFAEAKAKAGYVKDFAKYTISEAINASFEIFSIAPIVMINVLDPTKHKKAASETTIPINAGSAVLDDSEAIINSLKIEKAASSYYVKDTDYTASWKDGKIEIEAIPGGGITESLKEIKVQYDRLDPSAVKEDDILKGIEKVKQVYPKFNVIPGILIVPNWSQKTTVYNKMASIAEKINGMFNFTFTADLDDTKIKEYSEAPKWKNDNGYTNKRSFVYYPKGQIDGTIYNLSTLAAALTLKLDAANEGVPYRSPSNKDMKITGLCDSTGSEIVLDLEHANFLNDNGICTAINMNGYKIWGDYTAAYPGTTDIKDMYIAVRRMFDWQGNNFILTYWQKIDDPTNIVLVQSIVDSENIRAAGYKAKYQIAEMKIEYLSSLNPTTSLAQGKIYFLQKLAPFIPAQVINNILEYDTTALEGLF